MEDKNRKKIQAMREGGRILSNVMENILKKIKPGITEIELDMIAEKLIMSAGAEPGFKKVDGYSNSICVSTNDVVVHGVPRDKTLKSGDVVGIDCGVYFNGYHTDMAESVIVGELVDKNVDQFLSVGKKAMFGAIKKAVVGNHVGDISEAIQEIIERNGYSVVRSLVGHGIGKDLHEEPEIPGYLKGEKENTPKLITGMTLAIEAIYNRGKSDVKYHGADDWTIITSDKSLAGLFERTIAITDGGAEFLTFLPGENN